jgi:hypothetical protein
MSAWTVIQHIEVPSAQADITFSSIPATYTDLVIVASIRSTTSAATMDAVGVRFNGSTSNYTTRRLIGTGSTRYSDTISTNQASVGLILVGIVPASTATASTFGNQFIYIPNYTAAINKSVSGDGVGEDNQTFAEGGIHAGLWSDTTAINSIALVPYYTGAQWAQYSSATLYGVLKGSSGGVSVS